MPRFAVLAAVLASTISAEPLTPKIANIIPPDARLVIGIDFVRYHQSALEGIYPALLDSRISDALGEEGAGQVSQIVVIESAPGSHRESMIIAIGPAVGHLAGLRANLAGSDFGGTFAPLDASTAVLGDTESVQHAVAGRQGTAQQNEVAAAARRMSERYDNWFVAIRPFEGLAAGQPVAGALKYRSAFVGLVESVSGGIRIGALDDVGLEVTVKNADDAVALAGLARWVPGLIQMKAPGSFESGMADLAENILVVPAGRNIFVSFTLDETRLRDLLSHRTREQ